jgi:putative ABC transport system permease protein
MHRAKTKSWQNRSTNSPRTKNSVPHAKLLRTVQLALKSLMLHKLRSGLTMLGIVFGVFSVIAMLAIGEGASQQAQQQVLKLGATNIIVRSVKPPRENASQPTNSFVLRYGLKRTDFDLLSKTIPTVLAGVPIRELTKACRYRHRELNCRIVGCTPEYVDMNYLSLAQGRFISDKDRRKKNPTSLSSLPEQRTSCFSMKIRWAIREDR